jgi:hypothetical protein
VTFKPVCENDGLLFERRMSVGSNDSICCDEMYAMMNSLYDPIVSVRHNAGRTLVELKSPKGNGVRMILPGNIDGSSIFRRVDVFCLVVEKIERGA